MATDEELRLLDEDERRDQLLTAPNAIESDAAPRIELSEHEGRVRIDIADTAAVRPGPVDDDEQPAS